MSFSELEKMIDSILPDETVKVAVQKILADNQVEGYCTVELEDGDVRVPIGVEIVMITKAVFKEYFPLEGFGDFKVLVCLGKLKGEGAFSKAQYSFATLFFNRNTDLITIDFHQEWR